MRRRRREPRTVLWGWRPGLLQYNSREYWRTRIPLGSRVLDVDSSAHFSPGDLVAIRSAARATIYGIVAGCEPGRVGLER